MTEPSGGDRLFMVSGRKLSKVHPLESIEILNRYLRETFGGGRVDSVFSSLTGPSPLYGGRRNLLSQSFGLEQVERLNRAGVGFVLTLSNHYFSEEAYRATAPLLAGIDRPPNAVTITNDELARRIRGDFPQLKRKASVIRPAFDRETIEAAFDLYDFVTLDPKLHREPELLRSLDRKDRLILFANARCLYGCEKPVCYRNVSEHTFRGREGWEWEWKCAFRNRKERRAPYRVFDLEAPCLDGYRHFKLVPPPAEALHRARFGREAGA